MKKQLRFRRAAAALALLFLLCTPAAAAYTMTVDDGFVAVRENATGQWVYRSNVPAGMLSPRDQLLLEAGIVLENRADFTRAMEDFCS